MISCDELIMEAARESIEACIRMSPQQKFAYLVERKEMYENPLLRESFIESLDKFRADLFRWKWELDSELFGRLLLAPNIQVVYLYRLSHEFFLRQVRMIPDVIAAVARWMTGTEIYYSAMIGPGLKVIHGWGTVIGAQCQIGRNFTVYQGVTVGDKLGKNTGLDKRPEIGDCVIACVGSAIFGPVCIGNNTIIGANSVVLDSVPSRCVAVGVPAKVKRENLSDEEFHHFWSSI